MDEPQKIYAQWKKSDQKNIYWMIPFIWNVQINKLIDIEGRLAIA